MKGLTLFAKVSIGLVSTIVVAAAIYLLGIRPTAQNIAYHETYNESLRQKAALIPQAQALVQAAERKVKEAEATLAVIQRKRMPKSTINLANRLQAWVQWHEMVREIGKKLEAWPVKTGVVPLYAVQLPGPPTDPNQIPELVLVFPIGQVQVRASSFNALLNHVRKWNEVPNLLVLADGLAIQGTSPNLIGTYTLTVFVYPLGPAGPAVPSGSGGGAGGGMPGGFGGGFSGPPAAGGAPPAGFGPGI
ncbi:hypothetical protein HRbin15_00354 [bacterium HR15]|nr:hypothetical protein HRbin15_00354 [bacterium HR15]